MEYWKFDMMELDVRLQGLRRLVSEAFEQIAETY